MTRGTSSRRIASGRATPPGRTPPGKKPDAKKTGSSFDSGLRKPDGSFNWNRLVVYCLVVVALIVVTFPFWRGIVFRDPVEVTFVSLSPEQREFLRTLPADQQVLLNEMVKTDVPRTSDTLEALKRPPVQWNETLPGGDARVFAVGTLSGQDALRAASGTTTIYRLGDFTYLRVESFSVTNGPNLHLFLSPEPNPTQATDMSSARDLGELKGTQGNVIYPIDFNLAGYQSVVIYDVKYSQMYAAAPLTYR
jgi:hypothetical protein